MTAPKKKILIAVSKNDHNEKRRHQLVCGNYVGWLETGFKGYEVLAVDQGDRKKVGRMADEIVGVVFAGGVDVSPKLYGEEPGPHTDLPNVPRDDFESKLFDMVHEKKIPVLGICRGAHLVNVKLGGKLKQHIGDAHRKESKLKDRMHKITLKKDSRFVPLFKNTVLDVNSAHHQAVDPKHLGKGLKVSATCKEGTEVIEMLENADGRSSYALLVQWHPERVKSSPVSKRVLSNFEEAVNALAHPPKKEEKPAAKKEAKAAKPAKKDAGKKAAKKK